MFNYGHLLVLLTSLGGHCEFVTNNYFGVLRSFTNIKGNNYNNKKLYVVLSCGIYVFYV